MSVLLRGTTRTPSVVVRESGRSSIPETPAMKWMSRGVLDPPRARIGVKFRLACWNRS